MTTKTLLQRTEREAVTKKIGTLASPLTMTVAKLFMAKPDSTVWHDTGVWGACALVFDRSHESKPKSIRIYDLTTFDLKFCEELYEHMSYDLSNPLFHMFEVKNGLVGICFCDTDEGKAFGERVISMIPRPAAVVQKQESNGFFTRIFGGGKQKEKPKVSGPTGFKRVSHIGFSADEGFQFADIPEEWRMMFRAAGISKKDLSTPETAMVIFQTLQSHLGNDAAETKSEAPADAPSVDAPAAPDAPEAPPLAPDAPEAPSAYDAPDAPDAPTPTVAPVVKKAAPARGNLLSDIRSGIALKKVAAPTTDDALPDISSMDQKSKGDLFSVLNSVMKNRRMQMNDKSSSASDDWSDDD